MAYKRETVATVSIKRKPDWHYGPCVDTSGELHILGYPPRTAYLEPQKSVIVHRTGYQHIKGSDYELLGDKLIRRFDPKHETKERAKRRLRDRRLAQLEEPRFVKAVKAFAKQLGGKATLVDSEGAALPAWWEIRPRKRLELDWLEHAKLNKASVFARELSFDLANAETPEQIAAVGVVPASSAAAIPTLLDYDPEGTAVAPAIGALVRDADGRITVCTHDVLEVRLARDCPRVDHHARALARLESDETSVADLRKQLRARRVWLWWD